ncbi:MFS transporter [Jiangella alba]|uniref:MFS transporter n=1 Tax=Jiangella alba TaxID=561176 RepID=UPI00209B01C6|nr:MFS transporter [Jiangella alba]
MAATRLLPPDRAAMGVGIIGGAAGLGTALGPAIGGGIGQSWGWRALFWLLAAASIALIPAVRRVVADTRPGDTSRLDVPGGMLLGAGAGLLLFGTTRADGADGFAAPSSWGALLAGALLAALFVWRTRTAAEPFVPPSLFAHRGYLAAVTVIFLAMAVNLAALVLVPLMVIEVGGLTPGEGALVMIPGGLALAVAALVAGRLGARGANEGTLALAGLVLVAAAMLFLSTVAAGAAPWLAGVAVAVLGAGFAVVVTLTTTAIGSLLPPEQAGAGVGVFQGAQFLGAGAGPAVFGVVLSAREGTGRLNPLHTGPAAAYSDTFLVLALLALAAMIAALWLRRARAAAPSVSSARVPG